MQETKWMIKRIVDKDWKALYTENEKTSRYIMKYNEDVILDEVRSYVSSTYDRHYSSGNIQTLDLIEAVGDAEAFCRSNILKYASRYDRKGTPKDDMLKIMHYAILLYHFNQHNNDSNYSNLPNT